MSQTKAPIKVLLTGFNVFGHFERNPTEELVLYIQERKPSHKPEAFTIETVVLPVLYYESWSVLQKKIEDFQPDVILATGYAPESAGIRLEAVAWNCDEGHPDNKGKRHSGDIVEDAPTMYKTSLPLSKIKASLMEKRISCAISQDAGGYLCNHIFYHIMHYAARKKSVRAGFIHVPNWKPHGRHGLWEVVTCVLDAMESTS